MSKFSYNSNIFTNINKTDNNGNPFGILVSGKFNQLNDRWYPILDAIDIDWDGAFVENLNTYINTTEELILALNLLSYQSNSISYSLSNYYLTLSYYSYLNDKNREEMVDLITYLSSYSISYIEDVVMSDLLHKYDVLSEISEFVIDRSRYIEIDYDLIVKDGKIIRPNRYYVEHNNVFEEVDYEYILTHPDEQYYDFLIHDIINLNNAVSVLNEAVGKEEYNIYTNTYSYTGLFERVNNINNNVIQVSELLDETYATVQDLQEDNQNIHDILETSYANIVSNTEKIGYHTTYNVYKAIDEYTPEIMNYIQSQGGVVYYKDPETESYIATTYHQNYTGQYYVHYNKIKGTGLSYEIEELGNSIQDNTYILYKLDAESRVDDISLTITPNKNIVDKTQERTIILNANISDVDDITGEITDGLITKTALINSFSYTMNWEILN